MLVKVGGLQFKEVNQEELYCRIDERKKIVETTSNYIGKNRKGHYTYARAGKIKMYGEIRNTELANAIRKYNRENYNMDKTMIFKDSGAYIFGKLSNEQENYNMKTLYYEEENLCVAKISLYPNHFGNRGDSKICMGRVGATTREDSIQEIDSIARTFFFSKFNNDLNRTTIERPRDKYKSKVAKMQEAYTEIKEERAAELGISVSLLDREMSSIIYNLRENMNKSNIIDFCIVTGIDLNFVIVLFGRLLETEFTLR